VRASASSLPSVLDVRRALAGAAAGLVASASRSLGRGQGTALSGRVALAIDHDLLTTSSSVLASLVVTGTNGKSTTTALAAAMAGRDVVTNRGANLPFGVAGALARAARGARWGVFEVDEAWVPTVVSSLRPRVLVWLNLSRDQLDRSLEVRRLAERLEEAARAVDVVVANADDPLVVAGAQRARRVVWVRPWRGWREDAHACPRCGQAIHFERERWWCVGCGLASPEAPWRIGEDGEAYGPEGRVDLKAAPPGSFNRFNALCAAIGVAELQGLDVAAVLGRLRGGAGSLDGRFATWRVPGLPGAPSVVTLLAKNPAGFDALVELLERTTWPLVAQLNARIADGTDTSWIWDAPWERLSSRDVIATGERATDLAVRLEVAGHRPHLVPDAQQAILHATNLGGGRGVFLGNYTAFWDTVAWLRRLGAVRDRSARAVEAWGCE